VFIVIPEPEVEQMVPCTYETLKHLGRKARCPGLPKNAAPATPAPAGANHPGTPTLHLPP
jgi:hypothetical protein